MGLILHEIFINKAELGGWELTEDENFYQSKLILDEEELLELSKIKGNRRLQWLGVRYLLHHMSGRSERGVIIKNEKGKPYLANSDFHISLSHTDKMVVVFASPLEIGVDIQKIENKIKKIAPKFLHWSEEKFLNSESRKYKKKLHVIWGAKEAMYKSLNRTNVSFKDNLMLRSDSFEDKGIAYGVFDPVGEEPFSKNVGVDKLVYFDIFHRKIKNNILVMAVNVSI